MRGAPVPSDVGEEMAIALYALVGLSAAVDDPDPMTAMVFDLARSALAEYRNSVGPTAGRS